MNKEIVKLNYLHMAPRKVRSVANLLRGLTVNEAEAQLLAFSRRPVTPLLKLLRSAVANAVHNKKMNPNNLIVESVMVNQGPALKRFLPRAQGRATPILKRMSHVILTLVEVKKESTPRFNIISKKPKKAKKAKAGKAKPKAQNEKENIISSEKKKEKAGFLRKIFNRKSI